MDDESHAVAVDRNELGALLVTAGLGPPAEPIGERTGGPVFLTPGGRRLDRPGAARIVRKTARLAGIAKTVTPHTLRHAFITAALERGPELRPRILGARPGIVRVIGRCARLAWLAVMSPPSE